VFCRSALLLSEQFRGLARCARDEQDPAVTFEPYRARADSEGSELVEIVDELGRQEEALAAVELGETAPVIREVADLCCQRFIDLGDGFGELLGFGVEQLLDPRQRYAGPGERLDPNQVDDCVGFVAPVSRAVASWFG